MDSYTMAKFGLESKEMLNSKQKSCGFYFKYFFLFASLIQFLIILGLVLFMVYGNAHGATESRLQVMEQRTSELHATIVQMKGQSYNMSVQLKNMTNEKNQYSLLYHSTKVQLENINGSTQPLRIKLMQASRLLQQCSTAIDEFSNCQRQTSSINATCFVEKLQIEKKLSELKQEFHNFRENCAKNMSDLSQKLKTTELEREQYHLQTIDLRKEKNDQKIQMEKFQESCTTIEKSFKEELQNLHHTITNAAERALPSDIFSTRFDLDKYSKIDQFKHGCSSLNNLVQKQLETQMKNIRDQIGSKVKENVVLQTMKDRTEERLNECEEFKTTMAQKNERAQELLKATWDEEVKRAYASKHKLEEEKSNLAQQLEEKRKEGTTIRQQLEQCQKPRVLPPFNPFNPIQRNPTSGGNFDQLRKEIQNFGRR